MSPDSIGCAWTGEFDLNTLRVDGEMKPRFYITPTSGSFALICNRRSMDTGHPKHVLQIKVVFYLKVISYLPVVFQFSEKIFT